MQTFFLVVPAARHGNGAAIRQLLIPLFTDANCLWVCQKVPYARDVEHIPVLILLRL